MEHLGRKKTDKKRHFLKKSDFKLILRFILALYKKNKRIRSLFLFFNLTLAKFYRKQYFRKRTPLESKCISHLSIMTVFLNGLSAT